MKEEDKKERGPIISIDTAYYSIGRDIPVDEVIMLEAYLIASTLISWTLKAEGVLHKLIDYIKIEFSKSAIGGTLVTFKITIRLLPNDISQVIEIPWDRNLKRIQSSLNGVVSNICSKGDVVKAIRFAISYSLINLKRKGSDHVAYLQKIIEGIKE